MLIILLFTPLMDELENNKYVCVIMQNDRAMKIVSFKHAQMAETMQAFFPPSVNAAFGYEAILIMKLYVPCMWLTFTLKGGG